MSLRGQNRKPVKNGRQKEEEKSRDIGRLLLPRALGTAVYQVNIFVDTILASLAWISRSGGVAALYYANRLITVPRSAIFALALAQAAPS